jgi:hypothetical protein
VLQILWHNKTFRKCLLSIQHHVCQDSAPSVDNASGSCVYCQLKNLFLEYQFSDSAQIPSTALRKTLAIIYKPELKFQLNSMDDAAECLEAILQRLHNDLVIDQKKVKPSSPSPSQPQTGIYFFLLLFLFSQNGTKPKPSGEITVFFNVCREFDLQSTLHCPQYFWDECSGTKCLWMWINHRATLLLNFCSILQCFRGIFQFSLPFFFSSSSFSSSSSSSFLLKFKLMSN